MATPISAKLDSLIEESETLNFKFAHIIRPNNLEAFFKNLFFELSPRELQEIPDFASFDRKIQLFELVAGCIAEVNDNVFRVIETGEHVDRYLKGVLIKIENIRRKICCFFLQNPDENTRNYYCDDEGMLSLFENMVYLKRSNFPPDPNHQPPEERQFIGKNIQSGTLVLHMHLTMIYVGTCNFIEGQYERLLRHVTCQIEIHNPTDDEIKKQANNIQSSQNDFEGNMISAIKTFRTIFKHPEQFDKLIAFMDVENVLSKGEKGVVWKGFRRSAKYEISSFHEALFEADLLKRKAFNDTELITLASNTFYEFKAVDRTMRNKGTGDAFIKYRELISRFKLTLI